MKIIVAVTGSIAAYRSPDLVKALVKNGFDVRVILSHSAEAFVSPRVLSTFCGHPTLSNDVFDASYSSTDHISWARWADRFLIYGATADFLARYAHGFANDFISLQLLAATCPVTLAPAMNPTMWEHPAVQENVRQLKARGVSFIGPIHGTVACQETGIGHIADIDAIVSALSVTSEDSFIKKSLGPNLAAKKILISAGPMQSSLDPARFLQNRSSGLMGLEIAEAASSAGADVTLLLGPVAKPIEVKASAYKLLRYRSAQDYESHLMLEFPLCDVFFSAAAVLDFEFVGSEKKLSRASLSSSDLKFATRPVKDFVAQLAHQKSAHQKVIAFAAETGDDNEILRRAEMKLRDKGADALIANPVREGLGPEAENNLLWILRAGREPVRLGPAPKSELGPLLIAALF